VTDADHYALADDVTEHVVASAKTNDRGPTQRLDEWTTTNPYRLAPTDRVFDRYSPARPEGPPAGSGRGRRPWNPPLP
jgi:hypothetical protein